jgi:hypothetical protein
VVGEGEEEEKKRTQECNKSWGKDSISNKKKIKYILFNKNKHK